MNIISERSLQLLKLTTIFDTTEGELQIRSDRRHCFLCSGPKKSGLLYCGWFSCHNTRCWAPCIHARPSIRMDNFRHANQCFFCDRKYRYYGVICIYFRTEYWKHYKYFIKKPSSIECDIWFIFSFTLICFDLYWPSSEGYLSVYISTVQRLLPMF
jgi:hypothetical protein